MKFDDDTILDVVDDDTTISEDVTCSTSSLDVSSAGMDLLFDKVCFFLT